MKATRGQADAARVRELVLAPSVSQAEHRPAASALTGEVTACGSPWRRSSAASTRSATSTWSPTRRGQAAAAGARMVVLPEATMCAFGVSLAPVAEPLDGPWADRGAGDRGAATTSPWWSACSPPARAAGCATRCWPPGGGVEASYDKIHLFDALRVPRIQDRRPRGRPGDHRRRRRHGRPGHLLRRAVSRAVPGAGRPGRAGHPAGRVLGCRAGQAGAVGPADQGPGAGQHQLPAGRRAGRSGIDRAGPAAAPRPPESAAASRCRRSARSSPSSSEKPGLLVVDVDPQRGRDTGPRRQLPVLANRRSSDARSRDVRASVDARRPPSPPPDGTTTTRSSLGTGCRARPCSTWSATAARCDRRRRSAAGRTGCPAARSVNR